MDVTKDPLYLSLTAKSHALDDWRARLVLGVLETAIHDLLGYRVSSLLVRRAEDFIYEDNVMFELSMNILGMDKDIFRDRIAMMKIQGERLRRTSEGSGGRREQK